MARDYEAAARRAFESIASWCPNYVFGRVKGHDRWLCSPLREDKNPTSFSIKESDGTWFDHATQEGGDALTLYARIKGLKNGQAYAEIMGETYNPIEDESKPFLKDAEVVAANIAALANAELEKEYKKLVTPIPKEKSPFPLTRYGDMELLPPQWLIKGILEDDSLGVVFGASGAGKSYFTIDMAASVATGNPFHGRNVKVQGAVVYVAGEGRRGIASRLRALEIARGLNLKEAPLYISHKAAALCDPELMVHVASAVRSVKGRVALIVIDTWARNMAGNENDTSDTNAAIRAVDELRAIHKCSAIIVHHSGQAESERGRGSSALRAALDVEYKVEIKDEIVTVRNTKMKDGEPPEAMTFSFDPVDVGILDDDGDPVISAVLQEIDMSGIVKTRPKKHGSAQVAILAALEKADGPIEKTALREALPEVKRTSFYAALSALEDAGDVVCDEKNVWKGLGKSV